MQASRLQKALRRVQLSRPRRIRRLLWRLILVAAGSIVLTVAIYFLSYYIFHYLKVCGWFIEKVFDNEKVTLDSATENFFSLFSALTLALIVYEYSRQAQSKDSLLEKHVQYLLDQVFVLEDLFDAGVTPTFEDDFWRSLNRLSREITLLEKLKEIHLNKKAIDCLEDCTGAIRQLCEAEDNDTSVFRNVEVFRAKRERFLSELFKIREQLMYMK